jgi:BolA protein
MKRKKRIENIVTNSFKSWTIKVFDISLQHKGHNNFTGNEESHFSIILKTNTKDYYKKLDVHKKINYLLKDEFSSGLHALQIKIIN